MKGMAASIYAIIFVVIFSIMVLVAISYARFKASQYMVNGNFVVIPYGSTDALLLSGLTASRSIIVNLTLSLLGDTSNILQGLIDTNSDEIAVFLLGNSGKLKEINDTIRKVTRDLSYIRSTGENYAKLTDIVRRKIAEFRDKNTETVWAAMSTNFSAVSDISIVSGRKTVNVESIITVNASDGKIVFDPSVEAVTFHVNFTYSYKYVTSVVGTAQRPQVEPLQPGRCSVYQAVYNINSYEKISDYQSTVLISSEEPGSLSVEVTIPLTDVGSGKGIYTRVVCVSSEGTIIPFVSLVWRSEGS